MMTYESKHEDLRREARNAVAAYMHHMIYDETGKMPHPGIVHAASDWCLKSAWGIANKTIGHITQSNDEEDK